MLLFLTASPVWAEGAASAENLFSRDRFFYLAGGLAVGGYLDVENDLEEAIFERIRLMVPVEAIGTAGADVRAGYRIHRNIAAEVQFQWFSGTDIKFGGVKALELETWTVTGNLKGYLLTERIEAVLLAGQIQPYLLAGVGLMHFDRRDKVGLGFNDDGDDLAVRIGGGVDIYATPDIGFYLDVTYLLTTGDVEGLDHAGISLGALFRF